MKYLLFIVLLMAVVIAAGCVGENKNIPVTPTQTAITLSDTSTSTKDPIIGVWKYGNTKGKEIFHFNADGTFLMSQYNSSLQRNIGFSGTWSSQGNNSYTYNYSNYQEKYTFIYDPSLNALYDQETSYAVLTPYQGDIAAASTPTQTTVKSINTPATTTPSSPAVSSNSGDQAAIAKISEMRNWMMPYMNAIAESLMAHDIIKSGSYAAILRNYIDQNLPEMRQLAEGATTKKAAAREFVAALEDLRTSYDLVVQATNKYNSGDFDGSTSLTYEANDYLNKAAPHLKQYNALK